MVRWLVIAIAFCGCRDPETTRVQTVRDQVCGCKTVPCGEEAMKSLPSRDVRPGPRSQKLANEMLTCMSKLYLRDRPTTDPDVLMTQLREQLKFMFPPGSASPGSAKP